MIIPFKCSNTLANEKLLSLVQMDLLGQIYERIIYPKIIKLLAVSRNDSNLQENQNLWFFKCNLQRYFRI